MDRRAYWVLLSQVAGIGPLWFARLVDRFGGAEAAWRAPELELAASGLEARALRSLLDLRSRRDPAAEWARLERLGIAVLTLDDTGYPPRLREIADPPPVLYVRGEISPADEWAVAVVGTRRATAYGRQVAARVVGEIARAGVTIVSGLARGIDTYAHRAALEAGGRTIAVLGSGLDRLYPVENARLAEEIVAGGAVISEFPLGTPPDAVNFPRRNRVVSGLALGTLVVEADFKSGAMITATRAAEQGRDVFAVPGSILSPLSSFPNQLLKEGAKVVTSATDVLEELHLDLAVEQQAARQTLPADPTEARVLAVLTHEPNHVDEICRAAELPTAQVSATLTMLELKGFARQLGGMLYVRT